MANDASMIFRIKGDASHVKKELSGLGMTASRTVGSLAQGFSGALSGNFKSLSGGLSGLTSGFAALGPAGMAGAAAVTAVAGAASAAAVAIFTLSKEAAAYGSKISDLTDKTGLGAEALTSLDYAAKLSGASIEDVAGGVTKFSKLVGEAAQGSDEAAEKLERFGVSPQEAMTDLEGALGKVFKRIQSLPPGVQRTKAAIDAFGKSGANLLPVINTMNGDFDGLIAKAKELGVTFDDAAAQEMDRFDDMLVQVGMQFEGLKRTIGIEFLPMFMEMATEFSKFIVENKEDIKALASDFGGFVRVVMSGLKEIVQFIKDNEWAWTIIKGLNPAIGAASAALSIGRMFNQASPPTASAPPVPSPSLNAGTIDDLYQNIAAEQDALKKRRAALDISYKMDTEQARMNYEGILAQRLEMLRTGEISEAQFRSAYSEATTNFYNYIRGKIRESLNLQLQDETLSQEERTNLQRRAKIDIDKLNTEETATRKKTLDQVEAINRAIVQSDIDRVNQSYSAQMRFVQAAQEELKARFALLRAQGKATEGQELKVYYEKQIEMIDLAIKQTNDLMNVQGLSQEQRKQYAQELMILEAQRRALLDDIARVGIEGGQKVGEEAIRVTNERVALEQQIRDVVNDRVEQGIQAEIRGLEKSLETAKNKTAVLQQIAALEEQLEARRREVRLLNLEDEKQAALRSIEGKTNELEQKRLIEELYRERALLAEEEFQRRLKEIKDRYATMGKGIESMKTGLGLLKDILKDTLMSVAQGLGESVKAWVLYGETGGNVMRKVVAETLAALASLAVVKVVQNLAEGFEALGRYDPVSASNHFAAAKMWGAVGIGAAIGGRLIAGDSFKKQSDRSTVSGGSKSSSSGDQGKSYSSMQDQTVDLNRASSFGSVQNQPVIVVKDKSGMFSKLFQVEMEKNSRVRQTIMRTA
jgi:DNA-binding FrmR family transcriptional regulator